MRAHSCRVLILHTDPAVTTGLEQALREGGAETVVDASCDTAVAQAVAPDVVVIDVDAAGGDAARLAREFSAAVPGAAVLLLADDAGEAAVHDALMAGAAGLLHRDVPAVAVSRAAWGAAAGQAVVPRSMQALLVDELRGVADRPG